MSVVDTPDAQPIRLKRDRDDRLVTGLLVAYSVFLLLAILLPLAVTVSRSFYSADGRFVGLANYATYFATPALLQSIINSVLVALATTIVVVVLAFIYAYALTRTSMPFKSFFKVMAIAPMLAPGLLKAIALIYFFGKQGVLNSALFGHTIYGPIGIVMASVLWTFPHAVIVLTTSLQLSDARLYEAAEVMRAGKLRTFLAVTLPGIRYGLISTSIFVFVLVLTDFGIPKVIGGNFSVLATDIYKEVIGQQNFEMGAVVSVVLLIPALIAFVIDRIVTRRQQAQLTARSVPRAPKSSFVVDMTMLAYCSVISLFAIAVIGMGQFAALVKFWPYNLELTLAHYSFEAEGIGWENFRNSLLLALAVATFGTAITFLGAFLVEKPRRDQRWRQALHAVALMPMAIPGLVLGLGYLLFINHPANPLGLLYGTIAILTINTIAHYYPVAHLNALTALKQMDREFEAVAASLKVPMARSFCSITVPVCAPAILDTWIYLFLNAMTTVSAVIFLYGAQTKLASVAVVHMDEAGRLASAAAMAMLIVYACVVVRLLHVVATRLLLRRLQRWRMA